MTEFIKVVRILEISAHCYNCRTEFTLRIEQEDAATNKDFEDVKTGNYW